MFFFVWRFQIGMFDGSRSEDCAIYIEQFEQKEIITNNRYVDK